MSEAADPFRARSPESTERILQTVRAATARALIEEEPAEVAVPEVKTDHLGPGERADSIEITREVVARARERMEARR